MKAYIFLSIILLSLAGCQQQSTVQQGSEVLGSSKKVARYGMITGLRPEKIAYYKQLHASPWPSVMKKLDECNIKNYSIYLQQIKDEYYLFSYFEYTGDDFPKDMKNMASDTATQRWWKETDPCQKPLEQALLDKKIWTPMEELFHH